MLAILGVWHQINGLCFKLDSSEALFMHIINEFEVEDVIMVMTITWALWCNMNQVIWDGNGLSHVQIIHLAKTSVDEWCSVWFRVESCSLPVGCYKWHAPPLGYFKITVDASFYKEELRSVIGRVLRGDDENFVEACTMVLSGLLRVDEGEAWGVLKAITWAVSLGLSSVIIEMDVKRVRDAYHSEEANASSFGDYVMARKSFVSSWSHFSVMWVNRNANALAHSFVRASHLFESPHYWNEPPDFVDGPF